MRILSTKLTLAVLAAFAMALATPFAAEAAVPAHATALTKHPLHRVVAHHHPRHHHRAVHHNHKPI